MQWNGQGEMGRGGGEGGGTKATVHLLRTSLRVSTECGRTTNCVHSHLRSVDQRCLSRDVSHAAGLLHFVLNFTTMKMVILIVVCCVAFLS